MSHNDPTNSLRASKQDLGKPSVKTATVSVQEPDDIDHYNQKVGKFNYISIETNFMERKKPQRLICINTNPTTLKSNTLKYIRNNQSIRYQYIVKNGEIRVLYRGNPLYSYKIMYLSNDKNTVDEPQSVSQADDTPIFGTIPFISSDIDESEDDE